MVPESNRRPTPGRFSRLVAVSGLSREVVTDGRFWARIGRDVGATAAATAAGAGAGWAMWNYLNAQAATARTVIPHRTDNAPDGDGVYHPDGSVTRYTRDAHVDLFLAVFGDSTAAGLGVDLSLIHI